MTHGKRRTRRSSRTSLFQQRHMLLYMLHLETHPCELRAEVEGAKLRRLTFPLSSIWTNTRDRAYVSFRFRNNNCFLFFPGAELKSCKRPINNSERSGAMTRNRITQSAVVADKVATGGARGRGRGRSAEYFKRVNRALTMIHEPLGRSRTAFVATNDVSSLVRATNYL